MARLATTPPPAPRVYDGRELGRLLPHAARDVAQLVNVVGKRGNGKTTGQEAFIETRTPRLLVVTPRRNDFLRVPQALDLEEALEDLEDGTPCRRRVVVDVDTAADFSTALDFGEHLFRRCCESLRDALLVVSELHLFAEAPPKPANAFLAALVTQGRHWGVRMMVDAQRAQMLPGIMLSEGTHLVVFRTTRPRDLDVIEEWSDEAHRLAAAELDVGQCLIVEL